MHALLVEVDVDTGRIEEAMAMLHEQVVPAVKAAPGFVGAYWVGSPESGTGTSIAAFESEDAARNAMEHAPRPPEGAPVKVTRFELVPVLAHA
jgi:hypothetical protein